jgi:hypothetical protein
MVAWIGMRRKSVVSMVLLLTLLMGLGNPAQASSAPAGVQKSALRILYTGHPGSNREKDFVAFLQEHFHTVRTGDLRTFQEADTQNVDVTLLDWDWNKLNGPRPRLSQSFSRPVMTLGVAGGMICDDWRLKAGYA